MSKAAPKAACPYKVDARALKAEIMQALVTKKSFAYVSLARARAMLLLNMITEAQVPHCAACGVARIRDV